MEALRERVDHRDAHPVQAAGDLVAAALAELAAGVQNSEHDLGGRLLLLGVLVDGDPAAVVGHGDRVIRMNRQPNLVAVAGERLVDRVVDDLVDEVVEAARAGGADVHARALAHRVESAENGDLRRRVSVRILVLGSRRSFALGSRLGCHSGQTPSVGVMRNPDRRARLEAEYPAVRGGGTSSHKDTRTGPRKSAHIDIKTLQITNYCESREGFDPTTKRSRRTRGSPSASLSRARRSF